MFDVIALGELLIDFTYHGRSENGEKLFEQNPGGAPANVLCALANLGLKTSFIGKVGKDIHGDFLRSVLENKNVDTEGLISAEDVFTTLAFVDLSDTGERNFSFARKPGADTLLSSNEIDFTRLSKCKVFHFGSISLTDEPSRTATLDAIHEAKKAGAIISCDPNYRASLWNSKDDAIKQIHSVLGLVDIIKISDEEIELISESTSYETAAKDLIDMGVSCVVITLGDKGAYVATKTANTLVPVPRVHVVDTTGAGDAFWGGFLQQLISSGISLEQLDKENLTNFAKFANAAASLCVQKRGGIPALPTMEEVLNFLDTVQF